MTDRSDSTLRVLTFVFKHVGNPILSKQMRECSTTKLMEASQAHFKCQETNCTIFYLLEGDYWSFGLLD